MLPTNFSYRPTISNRLSVVTFCSRTPTDASRSVTVLYGLLYTSENYIMYIVYGRLVATEVNARHTHKPQ